MDIPDYDDIGDYQERTPPYVAIRLQRLFNKNPLNSFIFSEDAYIPRNLLYNHVTDWTLYSGSAMSLIDDEPDNLVFQVLTTFNFAVNGNKPFEVVNKYINNKHIRVFKNISLVEYYNQIEETNTDILDAKIQRDQAKYELKLKLMQETEKLRKDRESFKLEKKLTLLREAERIKAEKILLKAKLKTDELNNQLQFKQEQHSSIIRFINEKCIMEGVSSANDLYIHYTDFCDQYSLAKAEYKTFIKTLKEINHPYKDRHTINKTLHFMALSIK